MDEYKRKLYDKRAKWADLESEVADAKKYMVVGGFWWRLYSWFGRTFEQERNEVQAEIDELHGICDWCGYRVKNPCRTKSHREQCEFS